MPLCATEHAVERLVGRAINHVAAYAALEHHDIDIEIRQCVKDFVELRLLACRRLRPVEAIGRSKPHGTHLPLRLRHGGTSGHQKYQQAGCYLRHVSMQLTHAGLARRKLNQYLSQWQTGAGIFVPDFPHFVP